MREYKDTCTEFHPTKSKISWLEFGGVEVSLASKCVAHPIMELTIMWSPNRTLDCLLMVLERDPHTAISVHKEYFLVFKNSSFQVGISNQFWSVREHIFWVSVSFESTEQYVSRSKWKFGISFPVRCILTIWYCLYFRGCFVCRIRQIYDIFFMAIIFIPVCLTTLLRTLNSTSLSILYCVPFAPNPKFKLPFQTSMFIKSVKRFWLDK